MTNKYVVFHSTRTVTKTLVEADSEDGALEVYQNSTYSPWKEQSIETTSVLEAKIVSSLVPATPVQTAEIVRD